MVAAAMDQKEEKKKGGQMVGSSTDPRSVLPSLLELRVFWLIEDISEILDAPSGPLFAFFSPSSVRIWNRKSFVNHIYSNPASIQKWYISLISSTFHGIGKKKEVRFSWTNKYKIIRYKSRAKEKIPFDPLLKSKKPLLKLVRHFPSTRLTSKQESCQVRSRQRAVSKILATTSRRFLVVIGEKENDSWRSNEQPR